MLLVKTKLESSKIHGVGVFANQFIKKGTITWRFDPKFDIYFTKKEVSKMPKIKRELVKHFAFLSKQTGKYVYSLDNSRFANHSLNPNISNTKILPGDKEICGMAKRNIKKGEEMTVNYKVIDSKDAKVKRKLY